jgi:hypothetical protein
LPLTDDYDIPQFSGIIDFDSPLGTISLNSFLFFIFVFVLKFAIMFHTEEGEGKPSKVNNDDHDDENISQFSGITGLDSPFGTPLSLSVSVCICEPIFVFLFIYNFSLMSLQRKRSR